LDAKAGKADGILTADGQHTLVEGGACRKRLTSRSGRKAASDLGEELAVEGVLCLCREGCRSGRKVEVNLGEEAGGAMSRYGRKAADGSNTSTFWQFFYWLRRDLAPRRLQWSRAFVSACGHGVEHYWPIGGLGMKFLGLVGWEWGF
jgi:hypothetical protein